MSKIDFSLPTVIYGGSFDPVHEGHLHVAREVLARKPDIKQLVFVPAAHSPGKSRGFASGEQRLGWLRKVCEGQDSWAVWDTEVRRGGESYMTDTLQEAHRLGAARDRLFLLVGADTHAKLHSWKSPGSLRQLARILVVERPGFAIQNPDSDEILKIPTHPASSTEARKALSQKDFSLIPPPIRTELKTLCNGPKNPYPIRERSDG